MKSPRGRHVVLLACLLAAGCANKPRITGVGLGGPGYDVNTFGNFYDRDRSVLYKPIRHDDGLYGLHGFIGIKIKGEF